MDWRRKDSWKHMKKKQSEDPEVLPHYRARQKEIKEKSQEEVERIFTGSSGCDGWCVLWIGEDIYRR